MSSFRLVDYGDDDSDDESRETEEKPFSFTSFLFGNIAENGESDAAYLDDESKQLLGNLGTFSQIREVTSELSKDDAGPAGTAEESLNELDDEVSNHAEDSVPADAPVVAAVASVGGEVTDDEDEPSSKAAQSKDETDGVVIARSPVEEVAGKLEVTALLASESEVSPILGVDFVLPKDVSVEAGEHADDAGKSGYLSSSPPLIKAVSKDDLGDFGVQMSPSDEANKADEPASVDIVVHSPVLAAIDSAERRTDAPAVPADEEVAVLVAVSNSAKQNDSTSVEFIADSPAVDVTDTGTAEATAEVLDQPREKTGEVVELPVAPAVAADIPAGDASRKLNTPLASVLPPELSNVNVNDVFPDFKPDVVLRFSRLFGPGRPSSLPKKWVNFRKKDEIEVPAEDDERTDEEILEELLAEKWPAEPVVMADTRIADQLETESAVQNIPEVSVIESEPPRRLDSSAIAPWRYGPGKFWYDQLEVDPTGDNFNYGAKRAKNASLNTGHSAGYGSKVNLKFDVPDEAFLMISLSNWEQDVIWDGANFKADVEKLMTDKRTAAGWVPSSTHRTAASFLCTQKLGPNQQPPPLDLRHDSMFPAENEEFNDGSWMKNIIWDASNLDDLPEPTVLMLDPNDPNLILDFPEEEEYEVISKEPAVQQGKEKKDVFKRSRMVLGKAGMLKDPDSPKGHDEPKDNYKDPFNLSNDEYYSPKVDETSLKSTTGAVVVQHSIPILNLDPIFAPPNMNVVSRLRRYHRPELKKYSNGLITQPGPHPVKNLMRLIKKKAKKRESELAASGGGEMFQMREPGDLSACDGEVILTEYCEEYPPLVSQIGMATRIKNYFKRRPGKNEEVMPEFAYGEITQAHTSPFLGSLTPGQFVQAFENNMFRAPIYQHALPSTDFLIIRNRNHYCIRELGVIFTVGQECPLIEVPAPNSKKATNFVRDYLQVNIFRLFAKSTATPKALRVEDMAKLKVHSADLAIRKRLKTCADFKRGSSEAHEWTLRADFRLPSEEELREKVTPEDYCAFFSMRSAEQRLKDAGYGEKYILAVDDEGDEEMQSKMDDEIKAAPWNTTRAFIAAMKNNCILQLTGDADPTGRGEGFSYVKVPNKLPEKDGVPHAKKIVTGTDADLRKLSLKDAKQLLRKYGCSEEQIKKLSRWEIIALVRTLGTQQARAGAEEPMSKFARGSRYSALEQQEKYKEDCQRIFELQNRILGSEEILSTDDEISEDDDDSDLEQIAGDLEEFIQSKKSSKEIRFEREEEERKELKKLLSEEEAAAKKLLKRKKESKRKEGAAAEPPEDTTPQPVRKLKIVRTYVDNEGRKFDREEIVRRPALIDAYLRKQNSNDPEAIRQFIALDGDKRPKPRKYKRKQDPNKPDGGESSAAAKAKEKKKPKKDPLTVRCGACGETGHMRTNKECPMANETYNLVMSREDEEREIGHVIEDSGLVRVEGAKITLRKEVLSQAEEIRRKSLIVKIPKILTDENLQFEKEERRQRKKEKRDRERLEEDDSRDVLRKKRRTDNMPEYLEKPSQTTSRRRVDPVVSLSGYLKAILDKIRELPGIEPFRAPVSLKSYPNYLLTIPDPMDLGTMRTKLNEGKYHRREDFLEDLTQIVKNCSAFNGANAKMTLDAHKMIQVCLEAFGKDEERFKKLEKMINPLLDDNDQNALSYIFEQIITTKLKTVERSSLFHTPVNRKDVPTYDNYIKHPMDFETMLQKTKGHKYQTAERFLADVELIRDNCHTFNGDASPFSKTADEILRVARAAVEEKMEFISQSEAAIRSAQEANFDEGDTESVGTAGSDSELMAPHHMDSNPASDFVEEDTRHTVMSDVGDEELIDLTGASRSGSPERESSSRMDMNVEDRVVETPDEPDQLDDESSSRQEYPPSPPIRKKPLRLSMGSAYYEDARTGFDDESNQAEVETDDQPLNSRADVSESVSNVADEAMSPQLAPTRVSTLEQDLHVSDSESEEEDKKTPPKGEKRNSPEPDDPDEDGLWF